MPLRRIVRPVDPVAVKLAGQHVRQVGVPDLVGVFLESDPMRLFFRVGRVEQAQFDLGGVFGVEGEIDPRPSQVAPSG